MLSNEVTEEYEILDTRELLRIAAMEELNKSVTAVTRAVLEHIAALPSAEISSGAVTREGLQDLIETYLSSVRWQVDEPPTG